MSNHDMPMADDYATAERHRLARIAHGLPAVSAQVPRQQAPSDSEMRRERDRVFGQRTYQRDPEANQRRLIGLREACARGAQLSSFDRIHMVVSEWYHDEFGNLSRTIRQAEGWGLPRK